MEKQEKVKYVQDLLLIALGWLGYDGAVVTNFIDEAKFKIAKIHGKDSPYIDEIDIFSNGKSKGVVTDWQDQIITVLNKLKFELETEEDMYSKPNKSILLHCNECNLITNHLVLFENHEREITPELVHDRMMDFWLDKYFQTLKCGSCNEYSFRKYEIWCDSAPDFPAINIALHPKRGQASIKKPYSFQNVPEDVNSLYKEIVDAYINEINLLCAGGIRAVLETICINKSIRGGNIPTEDGTPPKFKESLKGRIYGLFENGIITKAHAEILVHNQYLGDKALHECKKPSTGELEIAIEIIAHTISSVYELGHKSEELKNRTNSRIA